METTINFSTLHPKLLYVILSPDFISMWEFLNTNLGLPLITGGLHPLTIPSSEVSTAQSLNSRRMLLGKSGM